MNCSWQELQAAPVPFNVHTFMSNLRSIILNYELWNYDSKGQSFQCPMNIQLIFDFCNELFTAVGRNYKLLPCHSMLTLFWRLLSNHRSIIDDCKMFNYWWLQNDWLIDWLLQNCWLMTQNQCSGFADDYFQILVQWLMKLQKLEPAWLNWTNKVSTFLEKAKPDYFSEKLNWTCRILQAGSGTKQNSETKRINFNCVIPVFITMVSSRVSKGPKKFRWMVQFEKAAKI